MTTTGKTTFLRPTFRGKRFDQHFLPVQVLPELVVLSEFIISVAKELFLAQHPNRLRVPKGFEDQLVIGVKNVEEGSAIPVIERFQQPILLDNTPDIFDQARDLIFSLIESAGKNLPFPANFPLSPLPFFDRFGRSLKDGETVELQAPGRPQGPTYSSAIRKAILVRNKSKYHNEVTLTGEITEANVTQQTFQLLVNGVKTTISFEKEFESKILDAFKNHDRIDVTLKGLGVFDSFNLLLSVKELYELTQAESLRVYDKALAELKDLSAGWLDGAGLKPTDSAFLSAGVLREVLEDFEIPRPTIYPTPDGGIQAEWSKPDGLEATLVLDPDGSAFLSWSKASTSGDQSFNSPLTHHTLSLALADLNLAEQ